MSASLNKQLATATVLWQLNGLYEPGNASAREQDMAWCRTEAQELATAYQGRVAALAAGELRELIQRLEMLDERLGRLESYAFLNFITQTGNAVASALLQQAEELAAELGRYTVFFRVEWNQLDAAAAARLLQAPEVAPYQHYLHTLRSQAPHQLSLKEEELLQELGPIGRSSWNLLFEKVMGQMRFGEQGRSEEEVLSDLYRSERSVRAQAAKDLTEGLRCHLHILTHIFNTLAQEKMILDRLRRYPSWISAMNLHNELRPETVEILVGTVCSNYSIVHRYYHMKRSLLDLETLYDYDRYAPLSQGGMQEESLISWTDCRELVLQAFADFSPDMAAIAQAFFEEDRIHAPLLPGKRGGAFAHPTVPSARPYILVNYTGRRQDVFTVAHELGHGVHQVLAAEQGLYNSETPLVLAETASVFAEMLVFKAMLARIDSLEQRRALLCQKLESIFATVFRQVAMNRFEKAMHEGRRNCGELSAEQLSSFWLESQKAMFADSVQLSENYRLWWAYIPHFLATPGYVYAYAFGELLVLALYARYERQGSGFATAYLQLLAAGGSADPYSLLAPFDVHLDDPAFWQEGLGLVEKLLQEAERTQGTTA
ncbi:MAG: M3 family oligoendopeptidase [Desulfobulbaceae bacterium]|nr:M3 family oligoendopeptidase [Desulfobulbaceae bacterium]